MIQGRCFMLALFYANEYWTNHQPSTINRQPSTVSTPKNRRN